VIVVRYLKGGSSFICSLEITRLYENAMCVLCDEDGEPVASCSVFVIHAFEVKSNTINDMNFDNDWREIYLVKIILNLRFVYDYFLCRLIYFDFLINQVFEYLRSSFKSGSTSSSPVKYL